MTLNFGQNLFDKNIFPSSKENILSIPANAFISTNILTDDISIITGQLVSNAINMSIRAPIILPNNVVILDAILYGNAAAAAETWTISRVRLTDAQTSGWLSANVNSSDAFDGFGNSLEIDNNLYIYIISVTLDTNDRIYGARIKYVIRK